MTKQPVLLAWPDIPENEALRDSQGRIVDERYVDAAVDDASEKVGAGAGRLCRTPVRHTLEETSCKTG